MRRSAQHSAFRQLYEANYPRILGYALRRTATAEDAADVVAETFSIAWQKYADVPRGDEATLWLYGVARRVLANHHRRQESRGAVIALLAQDYEEAIWVDPSPSGEVSPAVTAAWRAMSLGDRELLGLLVWETLTMEQIALVLGCPRTVVKVRIHRARRRFARELERRGIEVSGTGAEPTGTDRVKPPTLRRHIQAGRAEALPDSEVV
jgi:RNA polymerase sigma factor (sigma-70 family)